MVEKKLTDEELKRDCALPPHLQGMKQTDRIWPFNKIRYRGDDSFGPRCISINPSKYMAIPPKLVKGWNVTRWMTDGDESVVYIEKFKNVTLIAEEMPEYADGIEMNTANPKYGQVIRFKLCWYAPSSIQKFIEQGEKSWLIRDPWHYSYCRMLKKREKHDQPKSVTGEDRVFFTRVGMRMDSLDGYYIRAAYLGFHWN